ncbi:MFS transporter [Chitinasiproducens palmae]|uniref:MFS transporter, DHA2 family, multidrug resistance protein n=1 Tax=Chitinasiproducens palmae TaxID=1770053 RepID=A0A1H2PIC8_9BURK|nr:MFS transporter [Chitinasiproducens palmae]SDV46039.1 MFS transporter, DHA2 family, multidrug resistance protein [Chitinasiproducens palmae]
MYRIRRWFILSIVSSALLLLVIDITVLYLALPELTRALDLSASQKLWVLNSYALVVSGLLLGMGTLGDRLGHKRLFLAGLVVFGMASIGAAFAPSASALIVARAMLGIGAAMMMPATLAIIRLAFSDERERAMAIGVWAAVASGGAAFGPMVGGLLLEHFWWGSVFLINVPIVALALICALHAVPAMPGNRTRKWDLVGSVQATVGMVGLAHAIETAGAPRPHWPAALLSCAIGIAAMTCFVRRQRRSTQPMLDFSIFRNAEFTNAVVAALISAAALVGLELSFSQRLLLVWSLSPLQAGLCLLPLALASFIAGPLTGRYIGRVGSQRMLFWSLLASALGMFVYLLLRDARLPAQVAGLAMIGAGLGATMTAASATAMLNAAAEQAGMTASIEEVSYELGGAIGVTLMGTILSAVYAASLVVPPGVSPGARDSLDAALRLAEDVDAASGARLAAQARHAFELGFGAVLAVASLLLFVTAMLIRFRCRSGRRIAT